MPIHKYYKLMNEDEKGLIDYIFEQVFEEAKERRDGDNIPALDEGDPSEHAVEAMAKWFWQSRHGSNLRLANARHAMKALAEGRKVFHDGQKVVRIADHGYSVIAVYEGTATSTYLGDHWNVFTIQETQ